MIGRYLNLGCGARFHPDWENVDFVAYDTSVRVFDLRQKTPYPDASFDVVYHSHLLEHFSKADGLVFLRECFRLLKPGGTIRVAVPDLERIAELYLQELRKLLAADQNDRTAYDWLTLELYDQTVRQSSGGEMMDFVAKASPKELEYIAQRMGGELERMRRGGKEPKSRAGSAGMSNFRRKLLRLIAGREGVLAYDIGRFRLSGEVHLWMYDRFSLARALSSAGFAQPRRMGASESSIPGWADFHLDTEPDGRPYKPDSLYMEASRS